jgi:two-component SAPR family response regulator
MLRTVLVDDEPLILEKLKTMLEENRHIQIVGAYTDPMEALKEMPSVRPDCAFLDIEMPGIGGIELAEQLSAFIPELEVVFATAYSHYAVQAFDVNAVDYMLKPIRPERLNKAVEKLLAKTIGRKKKQEDCCSIRCFGAFEVIVGSHAIKWGRSKSKELLAFLLQYEGKWLSKYKLCDEIWPDYTPERALAYLQICVHALRKCLREAGCLQLEIPYSDDRYFLKVGEVDWDIKTFEAEYEAFSRTGSMKAAKQALGCYGGEYLEGEDWPWSELLREKYICSYDELLKAIT